MTKRKTKRPVNPLLILHKLRMAFPNMIFAGLNEQNSRKPMIEVIGDDLICLGLASSIQNAIFENQQTDYD